MSSFVNPQYIESWAKVKEQVDLSLAPILENSGLTMADSDRWVAESLQGLFDDISEDSNESSIKRIRGISNSG